ncbi:MAG: hypothetical protein GC205_05215 [Bacteroidetes bacterium]|nr:hypothetical protein [Bacteroidota bacterium]
MAYLWGASQDPFARQLLPVFKPPKPRKFQYHFRFSDPEKEEREKRIRFYRSEERREQEAASTGQQVDIFGPMSSLRAKKRYGSESNRRMVYILAALLALACFIIFR